MQKLTYMIDTAAPKDKVWRVLLDDSTYRQWTTPFAEGSYAVTDWKEGSKALFLTPRGDGMVSRIVTHRPNEFISIEHLGIVKGGVEDTTSPESQSAKGFENYSIRETDGISTLTIEMDGLDEFCKYLDETWPKALAKVKELSVG